MCWFLLFHIYSNLKTPFDVKMRRKKMLFQINRPLLLSNQMKCWMLTQCTFMTTKHMHFTISFNFIFFFKQNFFVSDRFFTCLFMFFPLQPSKFIEVNQAKDFSFDQSMLQMNINSMKKGKEGKNNCLHTFNAFHAKRT